MARKTSSSILFENQKFSRYNYLLSLLDKKQTKRMELLANKDQLLQKILKIKIQNIELASAQSQSLRNEEDVSPSRACHKSSSIRLEHYAQSMKKARESLALQENEDLLAMLKSEHGATQEKCKQLDKKVERIKVDLATTRQELCDHLHELLQKGMDARQEGICWIIKSIWGINGDLKSAKLPRYLDSLSVHYLLSVSLRLYEIL